MVHQVWRISNLVRGHTIPSQNLYGSHTIFPYFFKPLHRKRRASIRCMDGIDFGFFLTKPQRHEEEIKKVKTLNPVPSVSP